jgi:hypothetical protein
VYLESEDLRREFVLNESGKVWKGSYRRPEGKRWIFGQFDDVVLPAIMYLLELSKLKHADRGNPIQMARAISAIVSTETLNPSSTSRAPSVACCEHSNEPAGFKKGREFLDRLNVNQFLKDCAAWSALLWPISFIRLLTRNAMVSMNLVNCDSKENILIQELLVCHSNYCAHKFILAKTGTRELQYTVTSVVSSADILRKKRVTLLVFYNKLFWNNFFVCFMVYSPSFPVAHINLYSVE